MISTAFRATDPAAPAAVHAAPDPSVLGSPAWERASAGPRDGGQDRVGLILRDSPTFLAMLHELGEGWIVRHGARERDVIDEAGRLITVRAVPEPAEPGPTSLGILVDAVSATAAKVVSGVAEVLRRRDVRENTPLPGADEPREAFLDRYVVARAEVDVAHFVRLHGVTSDVYNAGQRSNLAWHPTARWTDEPSPVPPPPVVLRMEPATPGVTSAELGRFADRLVSDTAGLAADLARRPATREAYRAEGRAAFADAAMTDMGSASPLILDPGRRVGS